MTSRYFGLGLIVGIIFFFIIRRRCGIKRDVKGVIRNSESSDKKSVTWGENEVHSIPSNSGSGGESSKFYIYNFSNSAMRVEAIRPTLHTLVEMLRPREKTYISKDEANEYITKGSVLKVMIYSVKEGKWLPYTTLRINTDRGLKSLKLGMVTSVWRVGNAVHTNQHVSSGGVQGIPSLKIHNVSEMPLHLNHNISIPPKETLYYRGEHNLGISLGLVLRDTTLGGESSIYPTFQVTKPITDIYYGVSSDVSLGSYSGLTYAPIDPDRISNELDWDDPDVTSSGIYTLEDGWM